MATRRSPVVSSRPELRAAGLSASVAFALGAGAAFAAPPTATPSSADLSDFIVNVARYASWPVDASRRTLTICHAHGGAAHAGGLATDASTTVKGLPVVWRSVATAAQVPGCNVLWLNADVRPAPREWLAATHDLPILTISNYADFTADGGVVGAYRVGGDWRFEINLEALQRSRISIAAAALRLSQKPKMGASGGGDTR